MLILEDERSELDASVHQLMSEKDEVGKEVNLLTQKVIALTKELADSKSEVSTVLEKKIEIIVEILPVIGSFN